MCISKVELVDWASGSSGLRAHGKTDLGDPSELRSPLGRSSEPTSTLGGRRDASSEPRSTLGARRDASSEPRSSLGSDFGRLGIDLGPSRTLKIELPCRRELHFHVFPVLAFNRAFWLNLERLGRLLGSTWALLGPTWGQLGRLRGQLGRSWGQLATNLSVLWAILGALEAILGALGALLGRS